MMKNYPIQFQLSALFFSAIIFVNTAILNAQVTETTFNIKSKSVVNLKEASQHIDTITLIKVAPKPAMANDLEIKKAFIEQQRNNYLNRNVRRIATDTSKPEGENLPFVEGGFTDSLFSSGIPNDNSIAVGKNGDIVSVLNSNIRVYKQNGTNTYNAGLAFFARIEKKNTWASGTRPNATGSYDPRATYDPVADRFIVVWLDGRVSNDTRIMMAVSQNGKPEGSWVIYELPGNPLNDSSWTDYPILGMTNNDFFITVNLLKDTGTWQTAFKQSIIWQIDKKELFNNNTAKSKVWSGIKHNGKSIWSICPADQYINSPRKEMYFLSVRPSDLSNDTVFVHKIDNSLSSGIAAYSYQVAKGNKPYGLQGSAYQPKAGFRLQTNDARILTAVFHYDQIQYAQNCINPITFAPSVMYGRITDLKTPIIKNTLITADSLDLGYPSMVYMGNGNNDVSAMLSFSHSSKSIFPGVSLVKIDAKGDLSPILRVKSGDDVINSFYTDSAERWGDYSGMQRKYNEDGVFFLSNSIGTKNKPAAGTYIGRLRFDKEQIKEEPYLVYPNPSSEGIYHFKMNSESPSDYMLECYDLGNGNKIFLYHIHIDDIGDVIVNQNLSFLSSGMYLLKFTRLSDNKIFLNQKIRKL